MVVDDITNDKSSARAKKRIKELKRQADPNDVIALSGNKADSANERAINFQEAQSYVADNSVFITHGVIHQ